MPIVQECSQKWYRWRSWKGRGFRRFTGGFAFGPIMFVKEL